MSFFLFSGCAGSDFDEATIPPDQVAAEMSFKRMANHGGIEPVVEVGQEIKEWQFHLGGDSKVSILSGEPTVECTLSDRSGINYIVSSKSTVPEIFNQLKTGVYGYATGRVVSVDRDFAAGKISAIIEVTGWRERK